jgi:hypothetical protein
VAETPGDCPRVYATSDQLGRGVVPELVERGVDAQAVGQALVAFSALRIAFGPGGTTSIRLWRFFVTGASPA